MWESLTSGTLQARQAVLESTVDCTIVEGNGAELYYEFPCAKLSKIPLGQFVMGSSTLLSPLWLLSSAHGCWRLPCSGLLARASAIIELLRTGGLFI